MMAIKFCSGRTNLLPASSALSKFGFSDFNNPDKFSDTPTTGDSPTDAQPLALSSGFLPTFGPFIAKYTEEDL